MLNIITDSMSDITQVQGHAINVTIIPLTVTMDDETFVDGVTIDTEEFYQRMRKARSLPKTSQVTPDAFRRAFKKALENDGDEVLCITGSSILSGTYQSATIARDAQPEDKRGRVHLVDSLSVTIGGALIVRAAAMWRDAGLHVQEIVSKLEALKRRVCISATVDELKYLVMGGRLPAVGAKIGGLLNLKPMIRVADGEVKTAGVCRGKSKVREWFANELAKDLPDEAFPVVLGHADAPQSLVELKEYLFKKGAIAMEPITMAIGSVIGSHAGPGAYGMAWVKKAD